MAVDQPGTCGGTASINHQVTMLNLVVGRAAYGCEFAIPDDDRVARNERVAPVAADDSSNVGDADFQGSSPLALSPKSISADDLIDAMATNPMIKPPAAGVNAGDRDFIRQWAVRDHDCHCVVMGADSQRVLVRQGNVNDSS